MTSNFIATSLAALGCTRRLDATLISTAILLMIMPAACRASHRRDSMKSTSPLWRQGDTIEARVTIQCPVEKVFGFYRDFRNLPNFLGDVMTIEESGPATSRWTIQGPLGIQARWMVRVTEERTNELIRYETVSSPALRTYWEIHFSPGSTTGETEVHEVMKTPLGRLGRVALALIGKFPVEEQASNLHRLKEVLETGTVNDTRFAVAGKFSRMNKQELKK
jgi:uncharacterized membrane protein